MLKRNSIKVHSLTARTRNENRLAHVGDFGNFLNGFAKSPQLIVLNID